MTWTAWVALLVICVTVWALIKKYETRLVLFVAGLFLCCISCDPMNALNAFAKSMTNNALIMAICSCMGFAYVVQMTKCDTHLVNMLAAPLRHSGFFLIPACVAITFAVNAALPTAAGCAAAVGATMIPLLLRAGISNKGAGAALFAGTFGSMLSPGLSHNAFVAKISGLPVMEVIHIHMTHTIICGVIGMIGVTIMCVLLGDCKKGAADEAMKQIPAEDLNLKVNFLKAIAPIIPLFILVSGKTWAPYMNMGVAQAMIIGVLYTFVVSLPEAQSFSKKFFAGMGYGYAEVLGIIIAAGVFAAGLNSSGLVKAFIAVLKESNEIARWGGSLGPFIMGVLCGSGDAAAFAFNEAVTPHAAEFGMSVPHLGAMAALTGALGRTMSPIAGVAIVVCGLARIDPLELTKRTAIPMIVAVFYVAFFMI